MIRPHDWRLKDEITVERLQRSTQAIRELQNKIRVPTNKGGARAGATLCPLSKMSAADGTDQFTINAGGVNAAGEHVELGGPDGHVFTAIAGETAWVSCAIQAEVLENTLTGNWTADPADIILGQSVNPQDDEISPSSPEGTVYAPLGTWDAEKKWTAHGCGDVTFLFCAQSTQQGYARFYRG